MTTFDWCLIATVVVLFCVVVVSEWAIKRGR